MAASGGVAMAAASVALAKAAAMAERHRKENGAQQRKQ
jgi:hypothetical protein